jgi:hypothetical protein
MNLFKLNLIIVLLCRKNYKNVTKMTESKSNTQNFKKQSSFFNFSRSVFFCWYSSRGMRVPGAEF